MNLEGIPVLAGYGVHRMAVINETGAGQVCYVQLFDAKDGSEQSILIEWETAKQLAWELTGVLNGYAEQAMHFDISFVEDGEGQDEFMSTFDDYEEDE